jgi:hypothetical protein
MTSVCFAFCVDVLFVPAPVAVALIATVLLFLTHWLLGIRRDDTRGS